MASRLVAGGVVVAGLALAATAARGQFRDVSARIPRSSETTAGVAWSDYDGDGDFDLYLTTYGVEEGNRRNRLLRNDGWTFADVTPPLLELGAYFCTGAAWGDYDDDGDPDLFVSSESAQGVSLFRNDGPDGFVDVTPPVMRAGAYHYGAAWSDFDRDGDLDLAVASRDGGHLFRNAGGGSFVETTQYPLDVMGWCVKWCDWDSDGDPDAFLGTAPGTPLVLARNDGRGGFREIAQGSLGGGTDAAFSGDFADYDRDGDPDLYVTFFFEPAKLFRNDGAGLLFTETTQPLLEGEGAAYTAMWTDFDNDGLEDLLRCGLVPGATALYRNAGSFFEDASSLLGTATDTVWSAAWADWDADGRPDVYLGESGTRPDRLLRNESASGRHWLDVRLDGTLSNRLGVGARVRVTAGGKTRTAEISGGGDGWCSQEPPVAHFGLGTSQQAQVQVDWPSGQRSIRMGVAADRVLVIREPGLVPTVTTYAAGEAFTLNLQLEGALVSEATLYARPAASGDAFTAIPLASVGGVVLRATIPDSLAMPTGLEYWVEYRLNGGTVRRTPFAGTGRNEFLAASWERLAPPDSLPAGRFVLFGFPFETAGTSVAELLEDDYGPYDPEAWRVGRWDSAEGRYREPPDSMLVLGPGRGFWLISREARLPSAAGRAPDFRDGVEIVLQPGWSQIAHPFLFPVRLDDVDFSGAANTERRIVAYRGGGYRDVQALQPWEGYWMYNANLSPETIVVAPIPDDGSALREGDPPAGWRITVAAVQGAGVDAGNEAGVEPGATADADAGDAAEPPGLPGHVRAWFLRPGPDGSSRELTRDLRPESATGHVWELVVESGDGEPVSLSFGGTESLPAGWVCGLVSEDTFAFTDLRDRSAFALAAGRTHRLRLVAGTPEFVDAARTGALDAPGSFALTPAWPNPFAGETRFGFVLPRRGPVSLTVHDIGGRLVRTLRDGELAAGRHEVRWEGTDERGRAVASGVYFVRLEADGREASRKLLLRR